MPRIVVTNPFPSMASPVPGDAMLVVPHRLAADPAAAKRSSLRGLAADVLRNKGLAAASAVVSHFLLKEAISEVIPRADATAVANRLKQILKTVLRTGINTDDLIRTGSKSAVQLGRVAARYREKLRAGGLVDQDEMLWEASQVAEPGPRMIVYGYHRARKEEIFFVNAIAGEGSIFYLPCGTDAMFTANNLWLTVLERRGWVVDEEAVKNDPSPGMAASKFLGALVDVDPEKVKASRYADLESEVRGVLGSVKHLIATGVPPKDIAIVCRDAEVYAGTLSCVSEEYGLPLNIMHKVPLSQTWTGSFVGLLLDAAVGGFSFELTSRLLNHPYGPGLPQGGWADARRSCPKTFEGWKQLGAEIDCLFWEEAIPVGERLRCLREALDVFDVRRKSAANAREAVAYRSILDVMKDLAGQHDDTPVSVGAFAAIVNEALVSSDTHLDPSGIGVLVAEPNMVVGARFRHVFVIGLAEGMYPGSIVDNPVVDFHERALLVKEGIDFEEAAEVPRWEALSFYFLLLAAEEKLHFSYPQCVNDVEKIAGPFFDRLGVRPAPSISVTAASPEELRSRYLLNNVGSHDELCAGARTRYAVELERESVNPCGEYDGSLQIPFDPGSMRWSVSQLTSLGQCGFKWFARKVLRLDPLEEAESGLSPLTRGNLYHKTLEIAVGRSLNSADIREVVLAALEEAFAEAEADPKVRLPELPNWELQRLEHLDILRKVIQAPDFIRSDAQVVAVEQGYQAEWLGFRLSGSIDRIDRTADGLVAIDYKTSSSAPIGVQNAQGKAAVDLQLPIYINVALPALYPDEAVAAGAYYSLTKGKNIKKVKPELQAEVVEFAERAKKMLAEGNFAVGPDAEGKVCGYCDFDSVCRTGYRMSRKGGGK